MQISRSRHVPRGFSLLEGVFSLFLTFLVLGSLTYVLRQAGTVKSNVKNLDAFNEVNHVLMLLKSDIRAALRVPTKREIEESALTVTRVDPQRKFLDRTHATDGSDSPYELHELVTVRYYLDQGIVKRRVTFSDADQVVERLVKASAFKVERSDSPPMLTVSVDTTHERVTKRQTLRVALTL